MGSILSGAYAKAELYIQTNPRVVADDDLYHYDVALYSTPDAEIMHIFRQCYPRAWAFTLWTI